MQNFCSASHVAAGLGSLLSRFPHLRRRGIYVLGLGGRRRGKKMKRGESRRKRGIHVLGLGGKWRTEEDHADIHSRCGRDTILFSLSFYFALVQFNILCIC